MKGEAAGQNIKKQVLKVQKLHQRLDHIRTDYSNQIINELVKTKPSSKTCHACGNIKSDLKLSDRIYTCECGYAEARDFNASLNLRDVKIYKTA